MLATARGLLARLGRLEAMLAVAILMAIVGIVLLQVFSRYVLGYPLIWAEELATYLLIWLGFTAASVAYKLRRHIAIQTVGGLMPARVMRVADAGVHVLIVVVLGVVIAHIPDAMRTERMQSTVGLPVRIGLHWFFTVPTLMSFVSMSLTATFYAVDTLRGGGAPILATQDDPSLDDDIVEMPGGAAS
jgi:TRAP-type C4-dicarboxylate transport system permease small subunit